MSVILTQHPVFIEPPRNHLNDNVRHIRHVMREVRQRQAVKEQSQTDPCQSTSGGRSSTITFNRKSNRDSTRYVREGRVRINAASLFRRIPRGRTLGPNQRRATFSVPTRTQGLNFSELNRRWVLVEVSVTSVTNGRRSGQARLCQDQFSLRQIDPQSP